MNNSYFRLKGSKLPLQTISLKDLINVDLHFLNPFGLSMFIYAVYNYIEYGEDPEAEDDDFYHTKEFHIAFHQVMTRINKYADWWFKKKNKEQQSEKLNISKDDIDSVFRTEGNYVGIIGDKRK